MGKLDSLRITESPYAFASFAEKHNALVDLLASMVGQNGITVTIAEKNAIIRGNIANTSNSGGGGISMANVYASLNANVANVVNATGALANAYIVNANIGAYPSRAKYVTASGNVVIDSVGVTITKSDTKFCKIAFADITQNISLQNITVCNNGHSNFMLVLGSSPF